MGVMLLERTQDILTYTVLVYQQGFYIYAYLIYPISVLKLYLVIQNYYIAMIGCIHLVIHCTTLFAPSFSTASQLLR